MNSKKELYEMMFRDYPDVVSVSQMSAMLGISTKTAYRLLKNGAIKHLVIGRIYKIPKYYIFNYLSMIEGENIL